MIEVTIRTVDGVKFISNINILAADDKVGTIPVHRVDRQTDPEEVRAIKLLGMRKVGEDFSYNADLYTVGFSSFVLAKIMWSLLHIYWASIHWLYDNVRVFKQIPPGQRFSWRYLTVYVWYKKLTRSVL